MSVTVVAASGSMSLTLTNPPYFVYGAENAGSSGLSPGQTQFSRVWATSAYVGGAVPVFAVPGIVTETLKVYATDATQADVQADLASVVDLFTLPTFTLTVTVDTATYAWNCYTADYQFEDFPVIAVIGKQFGVTFTFPRSPYPVQGPI